MPTFAELSQQLTTLNERKSILTHLLEYLDDNFLPNAGTEPKKKLLGANNLPVPVLAFEEFATNTLTAELEQIDHQIEVIHSTALGPQAAVVAAPVEAPPPPVEPAEEPPPPPAPKKGRRRRNSHPAK
jgi:hypothetical protein